MDNYEIVITNTQQAQERVDALVQASSALQSTNERISELVGKIDQYWSSEQGDAQQFCTELTNCVKKVNTICSCDNELASAVQEYVQALSTTSNQTV